MCLFWGKSPWRSWKEFRHGQKNDERSEKCWGRGRGLKELGVFILKKKKTQQRRENSQLVFKYVKRLLQVRSGGGKICSPQSVWIELELEICALNWSDGNVVFHKTDKSFLMVSREKPRNWSGTIRTLWSLSHWGHLRNKGSKACQKLLLGLLTYHRGIE